MLQAGPSFALSYDDIQARGEITIAVYRDFPPYSFVDEQGAPAGVDIELAKALAKGLSVTLKLHWMTPDETVEDDMRNYLWKGMNLTSEDGRRVKADVMMRVPYDRQFAMQRDDLGLPAHELVHMFAPYQEERWLLAYDANQLDKPQTAARFMYHPVGVEVDTVPQVYLTTAYGGRFRDNSRTFPSVEDAFSALTEGDVGMVLGMSSQLQWLNHIALSSASHHVIQRNPIQKNASSGAQQVKPSRHPQISNNTSNLHVSDMQLTELAFPLLGRAKWELGIAVHTNYRQLAYALEDIVVAHIQNGDVLRWGEKYGLRYQLPSRYLPEPEDDVEEGISPQASNTVAYVP
ncbi:transporter substrate-binding domain-containing protein [Enterovibrio sp. ZSDZ42]|uniref:Transporter substrate-binding domain-containing protein n=1 Tax=Enterovibrio gelatinilyticus TaxID=2899819 RepID=A0ABT5R0X4_9GAMM|nr:transporter substrate-binding domain-containing protein [Enterovibrio sp. ZSDZ42]MDD1793815.1 transporter substrate-binding domain-containing protein [Enterovibrio sp. ZSDZ42]